MLLPFFYFAGIFIYRLPPINERLAWRVDSLRARVKYAISPPEQAVFVPQAQAAESTALPGPALRVLTATSQPSPIPSATPAQAGSSPAGIPSSTITPVPTAIPESFQLDGFRHEYQQWNNCGPANLSMALSYWGWEGDQRDTALFLKPNTRDKNVMPYEMADYVQSETAFDAIVRVGGDLSILKRLVAAGFPVVIEKGLDEAGFEGWMGHYEVILGYEDAAQNFIVHDSFIGPGEPFAVSYEKVETFWRNFNYTYIVIYPPEREQEVFQILGPHADQTANYQLAAQKASEEIFSSTGRDLFFSWFNRGTNLVYLQDYGGAAAAYDEAFAIYASLPESERPWRMMWYQTGPYWAYHYSGRYYDVINLATTTLNTMSEPVLEESYYWRALSKEALGDVQGAIADLRTALEMNANFTPGKFQLARVLDSTG